MTHSLPLALTMGEPAGIGAELAFKAWMKRKTGVPVFFLLDNPARLMALARHLGWSVPIAPILHPSDAASVWQDALPVIPISLGASVEPGQVSPQNAGAVQTAIEMAVRFAQSGAAGAVVTNPIHKHVMQSAGFAFPGHTEFLASLAGPTCRPVMMLACPSLRVVPVTIHMALKDVFSVLTTDLIVETALITLDALHRDFAIATPRLAIAGLNPHAGEGGVFGHEEQEIIAPAIAILKAKGHQVTGPHPPDTMFYLQARSVYDAALCMYHDQALIPIKTIDFDRGVNVTLGLPFIRTSPDHGTALDIAGKGVASAESLISALILAHEMVEARTQ